MQQHTIYQVLFLFDIHLAFSFLVGLPQEIQTLHGLMEPCFSDGKLIFKVWVGKK